MSRCGDFWCVGAGVGDGAFPHWPFFVGLPFSFSSLSCLVFFSCRSCCLAYCDACSTPLPSRSKLHEKEGETSINNNTGVAVVVKEVAEEAEVEEEEGRRLERKEKAEAATGGEALMGRFGADSEAEEAAVVRH